MTMRWLWLAASGAALLFSLAVPARIQAQATVPVLMLSDLHFDPLHDPARAARLASAPVEQWDSILQESDSPHQAKDYADLQSACHARGVDSNYALIRAALHGAQAHANEIAFVILTGDLLVHQFDCRFQHSLPGKSAADYAAFAEKTTVYVMKQVEQSFPRVPVYFGGGNNDSSCGDYEMDQNDRFFAATAPAVLAGLRDVKAVERTRVLADYRQNGSYSALLPRLKQTRVVALDDIFLSARSTGCSGAANDASAKAELAWLDRTLTEAERRGESAWVMGHIPPGVDAYATFSKGQDVCAGAPVKRYLATDDLAEVLEKHARTVKLSVFGHTHSDELRVLHGVDGSVPLKVVASVTPVNGNTPTFTLAQVDAATSTLKDYTVFTASNKTGIETSWTPEYSYSAVYHEPDFSPASLEALVARFQADQGGAEPASRSYESFFAPGMLPLLAFVWPQYACELNHADERSFRACACKSGKEPQADRKALPMSSRSGAGPGSASASAPTVMRVMCSSGVEARETAASGVSGAIPAQTSDAESAAKSRPGM